MVPLPDRLDDREAKPLLADRLYEKGSLSPAQAAKVAGYPKRAFMELAGNSGVSLFRYAEEGLDKGIPNAQNYPLCVLGKHLQKAGSASFRNCRQQRTANQSNQQAALCGI